MTGLKCIKQDFVFYSKFDQEDGGVEAYGGIFEGDQKERNGIQ